MSRNEREMLAEGWAVQRQMGYRDHTDPFCTYNGWLDLLNHEMLRPDRVKRPLIVGITA